MRKQDIKITTPKKGVIYAIGSRPESSDKVWDDLRRGNSYTPGYVLAIDNGYAVILEADFHPDEPQANPKEATEEEKRMHWYRSVTKQATALDAYGYTLADHIARQEVMAEYSHWPLSEEQKEAKEEALAALKVLPEHWNVKTHRTSDVRLLWADYQTKLDAKFAERDEATKTQEAAVTAAVKRTQNLFEALEEIGFSAEDLDYSRHYSRGGVGIYHLPIAVVEKLVASYPGVRVVSLSKQARELAEQASE